MDRKVGEDEQLDAPVPESVVAKADTVESAAPEPGEPAEPAAVEAARELSDEIPVPVAMSPAEIDERAQIVEALRETPKPPPRAADSDADADVRP